MSRKAFQKGLSSYQAGKFQDALQHFNEALVNNDPNSYLILDSRAAVFAKLGDTKKAMRDAKQTIDTAPSKWQGYARAARLFYESGKFEACITMVKMALDRLKDTEQERRASLLSLEQQAHQGIEARRKKLADNMGKLPIELFGEIASILVQEDHAVPIILSQVSKHWKEVVYSIPFLWDTLVLTRRRPKLKAKLWLERSQGKIRELVIRSSVLDVPQWSSVMLDTLRWHYLRVLRVERWDIAAHLASIGQAASLTSLERIELDYSNNRTSWQAPSLSTIGNPQRLRHLAMKNMPLVPMRFTSLTSLKLHSIAYSSAILTDFIKMNPFLEHLSIETVTLLSDSHNKECLSLPCLTILELKGSYPIFIHALGLPNLQVLRVDSPPPGHNDFLRRLVTDGVSSLTELSLASVQCRAESLLAILHISKELRTLEVSNTASHATTLVEALAKPFSLPQSTDTLLPLDSHSVLCPRLAHVNFSKSPDLQTGPLVRMIKFRLPSVEASSAATKVTPISQIDSMVIDECPNVDSSWLPWFRDRVRSVSCVYMKRNAKFRA